MAQARQKAGRKERLTLSLERGTVRFLKSCAKAKASLTGSLKTDF